MIYIISGTGGVGKTYLSNKLMKKKGIPYFSLDYLMMGIFRSNKYCGYTPMSNVLDINKVLWPIILEMIKTNIENDHSMIFEGFQILPSNIKEIPEEYMLKIKVMYICFSEYYIRDNYNLILKNRSVIEKREDNDSKEAMIQKNKEIIFMCKENNIQYEEIKKNFKNEMNGIIKKLRLTTAST